MLCFTSFLCSFCPFDLTGAPVFVGFVDNFQAEQIRVEGRLDSVVDDPTTGRQHFWLDRYHARILATLKDRVWRSAELLDYAGHRLFACTRLVFLLGHNHKGFVLC